MAVARRKVNRTNRKTTSKTASVAPRRKATARVPAAMGEDRIIRTLQKGLFDTLSGSERGGPVTHQRLGGVCPIVSATDQGSGDRRVHSR
jgi:hypothetical protein